MKKKLLLIFLLGAWGVRAQVVPVGFIKTPRAPFVAPNIVSSGLVLNLDAANPSSYAGSGTTWSNLITGNSVANFSLNNATYTSNYGGAIRFSSSGFASTASTFGRIANYTIEIWVKIEGTTGRAPTSNYTPCLFSEVYKNASINMVLAYNSYNFSSPPTSNQYMAGYYNNGWNTVTSTSNTSDLNNWLHIVATYDGSVCNIYKNGVKINYATIGTNPSTSSGGYYIAQRWDGGDFVYGDYSMVNLYNRALNASEVTTNYNQFKLRFGL